MEFGLSHLIIAIVAFVIGCMVRRQQAPAIPGIQDAVGSASDGPRLVQRVFKILFIGAWLVGWTVGLMFGSALFLTTLGAPSLMTVFLGAWTVGAAVAWVYVGWHWVGMIHCRADAFAALNRR